ncbi:hypothetical protein BKA62DRAFT_772466 [Auriculariales sp. MPI-PUGE-AT-0066]|nr:hypothetical protein BKA62DRAFT_772466 [Auriculariales sp. MPI-PUGE-AT-0066]
MTAPRRLHDHDPSAPPPASTLKAKPPVARSSLVQSYKGLSKNSRLGIGIFIGVCGLSGLWLSNEIEKRYPPQPPAARGNAEKAL